MAAPDLTILGIETSCDETAAALVRRHPDGTGDILANVILSQIKDHAPYGGVVPEIAARAHASHLDRLIRRALDEAHLTLDDIDGVAATAGPGLIGGLLVGLTTAKALALAKDKPLLAINHLEAHALTPRLLGPLDFPYLLLLISGGHTQLQIVEGVGRYRRIGTTIDDALGETFDKTAKLLGLPYPGGPQVEALAREGNANRFTFPRPLKGREGCNFSFSGLKTAIRETVAELGSLGAADRADICAGFEAAIADTMRDRLTRALKLFKTTFPYVRVPVLVVAGGVAANHRLKNTFESLSAHHGFTLIVPPADLCTDNAAMVAWAGAERLARGLTDPLDTEARARWPLDPQAKRMTGAGVKA
jgi:tRNA N6-adenosine threonylcarbamoyltransferase